jgi:hypothetical protein
VGYDSYARRSMFEKRENFFSADVGCDSYARRSMFEKKGEFFFS